MRDHFQKSNHMSDEAIEKTLIHHIRFCSHFMRHNTEIRGSQRRVLKILKENGSMTQRDLMDLFRIKSGSISELLGKLEEKGLIRRSRREQDRRHVEIAITESGLEVLKQLQDQYDHAISELFDNLTPQEKKLLGELLGKLVVSWEGRMNRSPLAKHRHHRREDADRR